jgi:hypothetical protein
MKAPLIALAIFSIGPSVIAFILFVLLWEFGINELGGYKLKFDDTAPMIFPFPIALMSWPFVVLYLVCRKQTQKEWPSVRSVRFAMWGSLIAMSVPHLMLLWPEEMIVAAPDAGQGLALYLLIFTLFLGPVLGFFGWLAGRNIAHWTQRADQFALQNVHNSRQTQPRAKPEQAPSVTMRMPLLPLSALIKRAWVVAAPVIILFFVISVVILYVWLVTVPAMVPVFVIAAAILWVALLLRL